MSKKFKIFSYVLIGLSVLAILQFFIADYGTLQKGLSMTQDLSADMKVIEVGNIASDWSALIFKYTIGLMVLCALAAIGFSLYNFVRSAIDNPKKAIRSGLVILAIALVVIISYSIASDAIPPLIGKGIEVTHTTAKWIDTGLWVMYITFGFTILAVVVGEVSRIWK